MIFSKAFVLATITFGAITLGDGFAFVSINRRVSLRPLASPLFLSSLEEDLKAESGKVCLVTGSARGIGKSIALELAKYGNKVAVNYIHGMEQEAQETVKEVQEMGGEAIAVEADCKFFPNQ